MSKGRYEKRKVGETGKGRKLSEAKSGERIMEEKKPMIRCVDVKKIYNKGKKISWKRWRVFPVKSGRGSWWP